MYNFSTIVIPHGFVHSADILLLKWIIWMMRQFIYSPLVHPKFQKPSSPHFSPIFFIFLFWILKWDAAPETNPYTHTQECIHTIHGNRLGPSQSFCLQLITQRRDHLHTSNDDSGREMLSSPCGYMCAEAHVSVCKAKRGTQTKRCFTSPL